MNQTSLLFSASTCTSDLLGMIPWAGCLNPSSTDVITDKKKRRPRLLVRLNKYVETIMVTFVMLLFKTIYILQLNSCHNKLCCSHLLQQLLLAAKHLPPGISNNPNYKRSLFLFKVCRYILLLFLSHALYRK